MAIETGFSGSSCGFQKGKLKCPLDEGAAVGPEASSGGRLCIECFPCKAEAETKVLFDNGAKNRGGERLGGGELAGTGGGERLKGHLPQEVEFGVSRFDEDTLNREEDGFEVLDEDTGASHLALGIKKFHYHLCIGDPNETETCLVHQLVGLKHARAGSQGLPVGRGDAVHETAQQTEKTVLCWRFGEIAAPEPQPGHSLRVLFGPVEVASAEQVEVVAEALAPATGVRLLRGG